MGMTRQRTIQAELWRRWKWVALDPLTRLTSIGLHASADDHGRGLVEPLLIKADIYPLDEAVTADLILEHVLDLDAAEFLTLYQVGTETFFQIVNWPRVDRPNHSDIPPPPEQVANGSGSAPDSFRVVEGERRERVRGSGESAAQSAGGETTSGTDPESDDAPSPFCANHPNGTTDPCRGCGLARLRHSQFWQVKRRDETSTA